MSAAPFVAVEISRFSSPSMGITWVNVPFVYTWSNRMGFDSCACGVLLFQQVGPDFPIDVEAEDDSVELCLTPCLFELLDLVSCVGGTFVLSTG